MATMPKPSFVPVPITVSDVPPPEGSAHPEPTYLNRNNGDQAEFSNSVNHDVEVVFTGPNGSPFVNPGPFLVKPGQTTPSGPLRPDVKIGKPGYHYDVRSAKSAGPGADPTIIVN